MASAGFTDKSGPGGIQWNKGSAYAQEMAKWEMGYNEFGKPGRPREVEGQPQWPAMFYKVRRSNLPHEVSAGPFVLEHNIEAADENAARNLQSRGYVQGHAAAIQALLDAEQALSFAAAVSNADDLRLSDKAKQERTRYEDSTAQHVAEIPETPIVRRQPKAETK